MYFLIFGQSCILSTNMEGRSKQKISDTVTQLRSYQKEETGPFHSHVLLDILCHGIMPSFGDCQRPFQWRAQINRLETADTDDVLIRL